MMKFSSSVVHLVHADFVFRTADQAASAPPVSMSPQSMIRRDKAQPKQRHCGTVPITTVNDCAKIELPLQAPMFPEGLARNATATATR